MQVTTLFAVIFVCITAIGVTDMITRRAGSCAGAPSRSLVCDASTAGDFDQNSVTPMTGAAVGCHSAEGEKTAEN